MGYWARNASSVTTHKSRSTIIHRPSGALWGVGNTGLPNVKECSDGRVLQSKRSLCLKIVPQSMIKCLKILCYLWVVGNLQNYPFIRRSLLGLLTTFLKLRWVVFQWQHVWHLSGAVNNWCFPSVELLWLTWMRPGRRQPQAIPLLSLTELSVLKPSSTYSLKCSVTTFFICYTPAKQWSMWLLKVLAVLRDHFLK